MDPRRIYLSRPVRSGIDSKRLPLTFFFVVASFACAATPKTSSDVKENHEIISTSCKEDWEALVEDGTCQGNGIESNPYVLKGLDIWTNESEPCVLISDSKAHFILKDSTLTCETEESETLALKLSGISNGRIENVSVNGQVLLVGCRSVSLDACSITASTASGNNQDCKFSYIIT